MTRKFIRLRIPQRNELHDRYKRRQRGRTSGGGGAPCNDCAWPPGHARPERYDPTSDERRNAACRDSGSRGLVGMELQIPSQPEPLSVFIAFFAGRQWRGLGVCGVLLR
jgi:hypothetical protein